MSKLSNGIIKFSPLWQITVLFRLGYLKKRFVFFNNATTIELPRVIRKRPEVENLEWIKEMVNSNGAYWN